MIDLRTQLLAAFQSEHREHMDALRHGFDALASGREADIKELFRRAHSLKGAARAVDLPDVEELAHRLEALLSDLMEGVRPLDHELSAEVLSLLDEIEGAVLDAETPSASAQTPPRGADAREAPVSQPEEVPAEGPVEFMRVASEQIEALVVSMHEFGGELDGHEALTEQLDLLRDDLRRLEQDLSVMARAAENEATRRASMASLARGLSAAVRSATSLSRSYKQTIWSANHAAQRVKEDIERIALVPASSVFSGFGHIIRDLARSEGSEVSVKITGGHVQADRRALQALKDPVLHLVRNSVRHGAQSAEERQRQGKPPEMQITIAFRSRGGRLLMTVEDDGKGPDLARIAATAAERGLVPAAESFAPSPDQLLSYVLEPGFSTSQEVDHISGRGMGLSVVAEAVQRLNGSLHLQMRRGGGLEAVLSVPLLTALQPVVLVGVDEVFYALPSFAVEKLLTLKPSEIETVESRPVARIELGGTDVVVPIQPTATLLRPDASSQLDPRRIHLAILKRGPRRLAVAVSSFQEVRAMNVRSAEASGIVSPLVSGTVLLDRGHAALVLNPDGLIEHWVRNQARFAASGIGLVSESVARPNARTILVVDDSITTRTLQRSILEAQGYRVLLSVDGLDALNTLRSSSEIVDLIIADVEMPRMDGFGLLQALKQDARFGVIPVIMMTSRADADDVRRGMSLGAEAYLTKQKFDQRDLLATVGQLL
ncbi:hybrid sensor histidine kinase/response regulator [Agaricicola taiwanensis]|uniref:Chemotaxis protein CheA n=1 Tax=Agaricicola taiwanensis TaxID=591372 RepID=A0A8J2YH78_9RHOB|nr:response regulator [Agaricicola taiwanensis]GGE41548.1 hybrid sensor histidine kinase/response regulator [Agaricicola taiwanensis]